MNKAIGKVSIRSGIVEINAKVQGNSTILDNNTNTSIQFDDKGNNVKVTKYVDFSADIVDEKEEVKGSDLVVEELDKKDPAIPDQRKSLPSGRRKLPQRRAFW